MWLPRCVDMMHASGTCTRCKSIILCNDPLVSVDCPTDYFIVWFTEFHPDLKGSTRVNGPWSIAEQGGKENFVRENPHHAPQRINSRPYVSSLLHQSIRPCAVQMFGLGKTWFKMSGRPSIESNRVQVLTKVLIFHGESDPSSQVFLSSRNFEKFWQIFSTLSAVWQWVAIFYIRGAVSLTKLKGNQPVMICG